MREEEDKNFLSKLHSEKIMDIIQELVDQARYDQASELAVKVYEEALALENNEVICYCMFFFGVIEERKSKIDRALYYYKKATTLARKYCVIHCLVNALILRGNAYVVLGKSYKAVNKYLEALRIIEEHPEEDKEKSRIYNNLGTIYLENKDYDKATRFYLESISFSKTLNDQFLLSALYGNMTELYLFKEDLDKAREFNALTQELSFKVQDHLGLAYSFMYQGMILSKEGRPWEEIKSSYTKALRFLEQEKECLEYCVVINSYAKEAYVNGSMNLAVRLLEENISISRRKSFIEVEKQSSKLLQGIYQKKGDYKRSYELLERRFQIQNKAYKHLKGLQLNTHNIVSDDEEGLYKTRKSVNILRFLSELGQEMTECQSVEEMKRVLFNYMEKLFEADVMSISFYDAKDMSNLILEIRDQDKREERLLEECKRMMTYCIQEGQELLIYDSHDFIKNTKNVKRQLASLLIKDVHRSMLFAPVKIENRMIGGMMIENKSQHAFSYLDLESLRVMTTYMAITITNVRRSSELVMANEKLVEVSITDGLTGLYNRRALKDYMDYLFKEGMHKIRPFGSIMIDIDFFKEYNDNYGHLAGDVCIQRIGGLIGHLFANERLIGFRYGGDEFLIILEKTTKKKILDLIENLQESVVKLHMPHDYSKVSSLVTLSIGAAFYEKAVASEEEVYSGADQALYQAKKAGRNRYHMQ